MREPCAAHARATPERRHGSPRPAKWRRGETAENYQGAEYGGRPPDRNCIAPARSGRIRGQRFYRASVFATAPDPRRKPQVDASSPEAATAPAVKIHRTGTPNRVAPLRSTGNGLR